MTTQSINLNVIPGGVLPRINVSQYDKGLEQIVATLYEGSSAFTMPSSATVYVQGTKKDGTGFQYTCSYSNNVVTIDLTEQMTVFAGEVVTELVIYDSSNNRIATCNFIIYVESTALSDDTQISETDIPIIQRIPEILEEAEGYAEDAQHWAEQSQVYATGALHWKGSVAFANIPTSGLRVGDFYNITDDFTTDSRFEEGAGIKCAAGTNIVLDNNNKWDILTPSTVASQVKYDGTTSGLSATNVQGAIDELNSDLSNKQGLLDKGQVSNINIDNLVVTGCYFLYSGSSSGTHPVNGNYILISLKAGTRFQIAIPYNVAGHVMMTRMYVNNSWTAWTDV
jgi:hypothetical protein